MEFFQILGDLSGLESAFRFLLIFLLVIVLIVHVIINLGLCFTFKKAGKSGLAAFVPIYNTYISCQMTGINSYWVIIYYGMMCIPVLNLIVSIYFRILLSFSVAKSFGKSNMWGIGLFLFSPVFYLIIGLGSSSYLGPTPMNDIIFNKKNTEYNSNEYQYGTINSNVGSYCTNCSTEVVQGNQYCHNCGKRIF